MRKSWLRSVCALAATAAFLSAGRAAAAPLSVEAPGAVTVQMGLEKTAALRSSPASAALGVDCGMADMCGIDPCTCGSPDEWGHCACNGTKQTPVAYTVAVSRPSVAKVTVAGGKLAVKGLSAGRTDVQITARLQHYDDVVQTVTVVVEPPYYLLWLVPAAAAAGIAVVVLWRRVCRKIRAARPGKGTKGRCGPQ